MSVQFEDELREVLPQDVPHRERLIQVACHHLGKLVEANSYMNLTRITSPEEAAVKHVYDCVAPWRVFAGEDRILDAGTGAGFPGVPLSVVLPDTRFTLTESIGKKARFVDGLVEEMELPNVSVVGERAETVATSQRARVITARAMAPLAKLIDLFRRPLTAGARLLLYKGPDVEEELAAAAAKELMIRVVTRYDLPRGLGSRTMVEVSRRSPNAPLR